MSKTSHCKKLHDIRSDYIPCDETCRMCYILNRNGGKIYRSRYALKHHITTEHDLQDEIESGVTRDEILTVARAVELALKWNILMDLPKKRFTVSVVHTFLIRNIDDKSINHPNAKEYNRYCKQQDSKKILCSIRAYVKAHQKTLERFYLSQYDKMLLVSYDMEKILEEMNDSSIDVAIETLLLKVMRLESIIRMRKYTTENNLILYYFKFNYSALLQKTTVATHKMLIRVLNFLSKRRAKKFVLDCQCKSKKPEQTVIKCGICATEIIPLMHLNFY